MIARGFFIAGAVASAVCAQSWVSASVGSDSNPCTRALPCRTFQTAVNATAAWGQVFVLDPGDYGAITITKAITIDGGNLAASSLTSGTGIVVQAGPSDVVQIRHLSLYAHNALYGIDFQGGGQLLVDNVTIDGFDTFGLYVEVAQTTPADVVIKDSTIENCNSAINLWALAKGTAEIVNTRAHANAYGVYAYDGTITVTGSMFSAPVGPPPVGGSFGITSQIRSGTSPTVTVDNCVITGFTRAINSVGAFIELNRTILANNTFGLQTFQSGAIVSNGNNSFSNNGVNGSITKLISLF